MPKVRDVYFDAELHKWLKSTARKERWKFANWYEAVDLVQEGYICYCKCRDKYTLGPPEPGFQDLFTDTPNEAQRRHFMSLVQRTYYNHLATLAANNPANREAPVDCPIGMPSDVFLEGLLPPQQEEASVLLALANAPAEISSAIGRLINDGVEGERYVRTKLRNKLVVSHHDSGGVSVSIRRVKGRRALRETTSEHFHRLLGEAGLPEKTAAYLCS
jgi:hypothetical protein